MMNQKGVFMHKKLAVYEQKWHPQTWELLKEVGVVVAQEQNKKIANANDKKSIIQSLEQDLASIQSDHIRQLVDDELVRLKKDVRDILIYSKDPEVEEIMWEGEIKKIIRNPSPLQALGNATLTQAWSKIVRQLEQLVSHRGRSEVLVLLNKWASDFQNISKTGVVGWKEGGALGRAIELDQHVRTIFLIKSIIDEAQEALKLVKNMGQEKVSTDLPLDKKRAKMAQHCFQCAQKEAKGLNNYTQDLVQVSSVVIGDCLADVADFYKLGLAFLDGEPKKILRAKLIAKHPIASEEVWEFVNSSEEWLDPPYKQALLARHTKREIKSALSPSSDTKKIVSSKKM